MASHGGLGRIGDVFILTALMAAAAGPAQADGGAPRLVSPGGEYRVLSLMLEKAAGGQDAVLLVGLRDGKPVNGHLHWPGFLTSKGRETLTDVSGLALSDGKLSGKVTRPTAPARPPALVVEIDATLSDGKVAGGYKTTAGGTTAGTLNGTLRDERAMRLANPPPKQDYAQWGGRFDANFVIPATGVNLLDDLSQAKLLWVSEESTPAAAGAGNSQRYGKGTLERRVCGGGSGPVVSDGLVYSSYFWPSGEGFDEAFVAKLAAEIGSPPWNKAMWLIDADDVVLCLDAVTGKTVWKATFPGQGLNSQGHKSSTNNLTPCVAAGKVFVVGSAGKVYGLDAKTGKLIWDTAIPGVHESLMAAKKTAIANKKNIHVGSRSFQGAPIYVDGVVITSNMRGKYHGFDAATGKVLWTLGDGKTSYLDYPPPVWRDGATAYVLLLSTDHVAAVDPKTGRVVWKAEDSGIDSRVVTVGDGHMIYRLGAGEEAEGGDDEGASAKSAGGKDAGATYVIRKLSATGAPVVARTPAPSGSFYCYPPIKDGYFYMRGNQETQVAELKTGKVVKAIPHPADEPKSSNSQFLFIAEDRLFVQPDGCHSHVELTPFRLGDRFEQVSKYWSPPIPQATTYKVPMTHPLVEGRLFIRGNDAIYCFDLRTPGT